MISGQKSTILQTQPILRLADKAESLVLCLLLTAMIVLACMQIMLRTFWGGGLLWADPLIRYLVLWCGLIGAIAATSQGKHIALDLIGNTLSPKIDAWVSLITLLFCTLAASGLTWAGWRFLIGEIQFGGAGPLSLPLWFWNSIFPIAFGLIALKYLVLLVHQLRTVCLRADAAGKKMS